MASKTPFEVRIVESGPAVAWTDSSVIFIRGRHTDDEMHVLIKHESAHIWLRHGARCPHAAMQHNSAEFRAWTLAKEIEIARGIYSQSDVRVINAPRSSIAGGVVPSTLPECPHSIAEDVYEWILKNKPDEQDSGHICGGSHDHDEDHDPSMSQNIEGPESPNDLINSARSKADDLDRGRDADKIGHRMVSYLPRVSLASALDAHLASRLDRVKSYRRPSRREVSFITPGRITTHKSPAVRIYVDRSGSFSPDKTALAQIAINKIIARYGSRIKKDILFFGNNRISDQDLSPGGNTPYNLVADDIYLCKPVVAIIVTDDDPADRPAHDLSATRMFFVPCGSNHTGVAGVFGGQDVHL